MERLQSYSEEVEVQMQRFYHSLDEKDRRRYAAIEAKKLGYGGISYVCRVLGCDEGKVKHGLSELEQDLPNDDGAIRRKGGGRKRSIETMEGLDTTFLEVMTPHTAGSPMDARIKWSNLSRNAIAEELRECQCDGRRSTAEKARFSSPSSVQECGRETSSSARRTIQEYYRTGYCSGGKG